MKIYLWNISGFFYRKSEKYWKNQFFSEIIKKIPNKYTCVHISFSNVKTKDDNFLLW